MSWLNRSKDINVEGLISCVYNRPSIWDQSDNEHHNRYTLYRLWKEVATENDCTVHDAQKKWKSLRDYFRKQLENVLKTKPLDKEGNIIFKSSWPHFNQMMFLKEQFIPKKSIQNVQPDKSSDNATLTIEDSSESSTVINSEEYNDEDDYDGCDQLLYKDVSINNQQLASTSATIVTTRKDSPNSYEFLQPKNTLKNVSKSRRDQLQALVEIERKKLSILQEKRARLDDRKQPDEDVQFFESLIPHVKNITGVNKLLFRNEIQNLVVKYAYSYHNITNYTPMSSNCTSVYTINSPMTTIVTKTESSSAVTMNDNDCHPYETVTLKLENNNVD